MRNLFAELKRRQVYRVGAAYAVIAWLLIQLFNNVAPILEAPAWVGRLLLLLLVVGFPIALLLAWTFEATLAGIKRETLLPAGAGGKTPTTTLDFVLAGALIVVIGLMSYEQLAPAGGSKSEPGTPSAAVGAISIAVLPFANMSGDQTQEFFSDGMTEEITSALAKIADLRVVGRTSAFQFKGENKDLRAIGQALSATHLIEGSVRKDGNEVRITAQLIRADDGTHLWTESYNRELKGVFAIQEEIATAIASALRVPLGLKEGQSLVVNRTTDTDSYQDYLRARSFVRARGPLEPGGPLTEAAKLLQQVSERDPNYAPAWGLLGQVYSLIPVLSAPYLNASTRESRQSTAQSLQNAETAARQAIRLDPNNIDGHLALGLAQEGRGRFAEAEDLYKRALAIDAENPDALHRYGGLFATVGRLKEALPIRQRLRSQEPLVVVFNWLTAMVLWESGHNDEALAILKPLPATYFTGTGLIASFATLGHYGEAAEALKQIPSGIFPRATLDEATALLRIAPMSVAASAPTPLSSSYLGFVYLYVGAPSRVLDYYDDLAEAGFPSLGNVIGFLWASSYAPLRKTERFKTHLRRIGLVDYWKARGWPDLCHPMGTGDFACD